MQTGTGYVGGRAAVALLVLVGVFGAIYIQSQRGPIINLTSLSPRKVCRAVTSNQLAEWFNRSLMAKPKLADAFGHCLDSIASYQEDFLRKLDAEAASNSSRTVQLSMFEREKVIRSTLDVDRKTVCLKVALASLEISPSLSSLEWRFKDAADPRREIPNAPAQVLAIADQKFNDLTPAGTEELARRMFFADPKETTVFFTNPIGLFPSTYGGNQYTPNFAPLLDKWLWSVTSSMECR